MVLSDNINHENIKDFTMNNIAILSSTALLLLAVSGCATKMYGKQSALTNFEKNTLTCRELDIETAKVNGFIAYVNQESKFSFRDAAAIVGDLYIGNYMEKKSALESANARLAELQAQSSAKSCPVNPT
jgi:hypothetical protein